jgi:hypothetical protein
MAASLRRRRWPAIGFVLITMLLCDARPAGAQSCSPMPDTMIAAIRAAASDLVSNPTRSPERFLNDLTTLAALHALGMGPVRDSLFVPGETADTNKQTGASGRSGGLAALVQKPGFPALLAFAVESGAVQANRTDTQLTLSSSLYALKAAASGDTAHNYMQSPLLTRVGWSATFDATPDAADPLSNARRDQLREVGVQIRLSPDRTVRSRNFELWWANNIRHIMATHNQLLVDITELFRDVDAINTAVNEVRTELESRLAATIAKGQPDVEQLFACTLEQRLMKPLADGRIVVPAEAIARLRTEYVPALDDRSAALRTIPDKVREHLEEVAAKPTASLSMTFFRPADGHDFLEAIVSYTQNLAPLKAVLNAGASRYVQRQGLTNQPEGWRDFVVAAAFEHSARGPFVHDSTDLSRMTISLGARYERTFDHSRIIPAAVEKTKKLVQARIEMPVTLGVILPVSFTVSNDEADVNEARTWQKGMFFGLTFDMDKFAAIAKALALARMR